ncbi:MAG: hypothetical protein IJL75_01860, partial [Eubacterium sp.]|nr:hypothetical protein [Eubacterium sp.]
GEEFLGKLTKLYDAAYEESADIREMVADMVPTYTIKEEDKYRDRTYIDEKYKKGFDEKD